MKEKTSSEPAGEGCISVKVVKINVIPISPTTSAVWLRPIARSHSQIQMAPHNTKPNVTATYSGLNPAAMTETAVGRPNNAQAAMNQRPRRVQRSRLAIDVSLGCSTAGRK